MTSALTEEHSYHGNRYLVDVTNSRQYVVRFDNGRPRPPVNVFAGEKQDEGFKPNEVIFALDDEFDFDTSSNNARITTTAFQIWTGEEGKPKGLKFCEVSYEVQFQMTKGGMEATFELSNASKIKMADMGFDRTFPKIFTTQLDATGPGITRHGNSIFVDPQLIKSLSLPPHQDGGALLARMGVEATQGAKPEQKRPHTFRTFKMADEQTLIETKTLDGNSKMKLVFNFEARRVSEIYETVGKEPSNFGYSFADVDREALEENFKRLTDMGGKPKPLDGKKGPALKKGR